MKRCLLFVVMTVILLAACVCLAAAGIGCVLNSAVLQKQYHFKAWELSFTSLDTTRLYDVLYGFLKSFGYIEGKLEARVLLHNTAAALLLLSFLFIMIQGIRTGWKKSSAFFFFSIFTVLSIAIFVLLYAFTDMSYGSWYNVPIVFLAAPLIAMGLRYLDYSWGFKAAVLALWCVLTVSTGFEFLNNRGIAEKKTAIREAVHIFFIIR